MFDGIKSKLGIGSKKDDYYDNDFDENAGYDDYDEYDGYDEGYDDYDDGYGASQGSYSDYAPASGYASASLSTPSRGGVTRPRLVSIDDVRASTQLEIDSRYDRDAHAPVESAFGSSEWNLRSEGLSSLFTPTTDAPASAGVRAYDAPAAEKPAVVSPLSEQPTLRPASAGYDAYAPARQSAFGARNTTVVKPQSYNDVERVARAVRGGDVVVLNLRNTQEALSKRLLDFSFGVASALDARVDCVADKVFVICSGEGLSQAELQSLKNQGAL